MTNMLDTIIPKSDQLNSDDLIGGVMKTITVTKVSRCKEPEQPIAINFDGDGGKPYKPCKSMRRVLVNVWGPDGQAYVGRQMKLYRDDTVKFGGMDVGGIRISEVSHIEKPVTMALTATRASRKPFTVRPLVEDKPANKKPPTPKEIADNLTERFGATADIDAHNTLLSDDVVSKQVSWLRDKQPALFATVDAAIQASVTRHTGETDGETDDPTSRIDAPARDGDLLSGAGGSVPESESY